MTDVTYRLELSGEVDFGRKDELAAVLAGFEEDSSPYASVDVSRVTFLDSTGLSFLVGLRKTAEDRGGFVEIVGATESVLRLLRLVNVDGKFRLAPQPPGEDVS